MSRAWTRKEDEIIVKNLQRSIKEISKLLDRSVNAVWSRKNKLINGPLPHRCLCGENAFCSSQLCEECLNKRNTNIIKMYNGGSSPYELSKIFNLPPNHTFLIVRAKQKTRSLREAQQLNIDYDDLNNRVRDKIENDFNGILKTEKVTDNHQKILWTCKRGHGVESDLRWIFTLANTGCDKCVLIEMSEKNRYTIDEIKCVCRQQGFVFNGTDEFEYKNGSQKLSIVCANGHHIMMNLKRIERGDKCYECFVYLSEYLCKRYFQYFTDKNFIKTKIKVGTSLLELDGYCEELNIAFEYNGIHHYESKWNGKSVEEVQCRDRAKYKYANENGIKLFIVTHLIHNRNLGEFILSMIKHENVPVVRDDIPSIELFMPCPNKLSELKEYVQDRYGGTVWSVGYIGGKEKHLFGCINQHMFYAMPSKIRSDHGQWCPLCPNKRRKKNIDVIRLFAKEMEIDVISDDYKNNETKLNVRCRRCSREFITTYRTLWHSKRRGGTGCRSCSATKSNLMRGSRS